MIQVVDDALSSATEARKKMTNVADAKFEKATRALSAYEKKYHSRETVTQTMAEAEAKDKASDLLAKLKELYFKPNVRGNLDLCFTTYEYCTDSQPRKEDPMNFKIVEPTTVKHERGFSTSPMASDTILEVVRESSVMNEILWNFSRFQPEDKNRLSLKDNPHFYEMLPTSSEIYDGKLRIDPIIDTFHHDKISTVDTLSPYPHRPTLRIQIPESSQLEEPLSPSSYKTARSTPLTQRSSSPAVDPSPRSPTPLSLEPPKLPTPASTVSPPTSTGPAQPVPDPTTCLLHDTSLREASRVDLVPSQEGYGDHYPSTAYR